MVAFENEMDYFRESDTSFLINTTSADTRMRSIITGAMTEFLSNSYITEKTEDDLFKGLRSFIAKIISTLQKFVRDIEIAVEEWVRDKEIRISIRSVKKSLAEGKKDGAKYVEMIDVWKLGRRYKEMNNDIWEHTKKLTRKKYRKVSELQRDTEEAEKLIAKYTDEIDEIRNETIKVPINKALEFVESEIEGRSTILDDLSTEITKFKNLEKECENIKINIYLGEGSEIVASHAGMIRRLTLKISGFTQKIRKSLKQSVIKTMQAIIILT